jgi:hypothetical protein
MPNWYATTALLLIGRNVMGGKRKADTVGAMLKSFDEVQRLPDNTGIGRRDIRKKTTWHYDGTEAGWVSRSGRYFLLVGDSLLCLSLYSPGFEDGDLPFFTFRSERGEASRVNISRDAVKMLIGKTSRLDMVHTSLAWAVARGDWKKGLKDLVSMADPLTRQTMLLTMYHSLAYCRNVMDEALGKLDRVHGGLREKRGLLDFQMNVVQRMFWSAVRKDRFQLRGLVSDKYIQLIKVDHEEDAVIMEHGNVDHVQHWFYCYLNSRDRHLLFGRRS